MSVEDRWLLPDGVGDLLPPEAGGVESVRRHLLDLFGTWGYDYVIPPMIEYLESLLTGTGHDLDLKTFKVVDLLTGRTMGVRADITPQVARIDAHSMKRRGVGRLCYAGTIVQAQADSMLGSRTPLSVGAELFGESTVRGDIEIVSMMVASLESTGCPTLHLDLGDVSIFSQLLDSFSLDHSQTERLYEAVQRKASVDIARLCDEFSLTSEQKSLVCELPGLTGDESVLTRAKASFAEHAGILKSIENLEHVTLALKARFADLQIYLDLSELRGYAYHTGIVFAAYLDGDHRVAAKGGRYDHIGEVFGREQRGATGFSIDVTYLASRIQAVSQSRQTVLVSDSVDSTENELWQELVRLRSEGYTVVESGVTGQYEYELVRDANEWVLKPTQGEK